MAATQDYLKRQKLESMRGDKVKAQVNNMADKRKESQKANEAILQQYDQATCEVDVF